MANEDRPDSPASVTELDVAAIRARADAATPGPWSRSRNWSVIGPSHDWDKTWPDGTIAGQKAHDQRICYVAGPGEANNAREDGDFIAAARTDVPALCDELESTRERLAEAEREKDWALSVRDSATEERDKWVAHSQRNHDLFRDAMAGIKRLEAERDAAQGREARLREALSEAAQAIESVRDTCEDAYGDVPSGTPGESGVLASKHMADDVLRFIRAALASTDASAASPGAVTLTEREQDLLEALQAAEGPLADLVEEYSGSAHYAATLVEVRAAIRRASGEKP